MTKEIIVSAINPYLAGTQDLRWQTEAIKSMLDSGELKDGIDYGIIPDTAKASLWLPGAQKIANVCGLASKFSGQDLPRDMGSGHVEYMITCELYSKKDNSVAGSGVASCSTLESKFRYRKGGRKCPKCGKEALIKGKAEYGGGWFCFPKIGGCGTKFADGDPNIDKQIIGKVENPDIADIRNTVIQMACKRAYVSAVRNASAAAFLFTQDVGEDAEPQADLKTGEVRK